MYRFTKEPHLQTNRDEKCEECRWCKKPPPSVKRKNARLCKKGLCYTNARSEACEAFKEN